MCTYLNFFSVLRDVPGIAFVKFRIGSLKRIGMNKIVCTKSHTVSKFSKALLGLCYMRWIVVVHLYCGFSLRRRMTPQQTAKFRTVCALQRTKRFVLPSVAWRHNIRKFPAVISQNAKKSAAEWCKIFRIVTVHIVINSIRV